VLQHTAQVLFFFWPPVAWVNRRIEHYRALACDEIALRNSALPVSSYARLLVNPQRHALATPPQLALEMSSQASHLERRINMLLNLKPRRSVVLTALTFGSWALLTLSGSAVATGSNELEGMLDQKVIQAVIRENLHAVQSCYEIGLARAPTDQGKIQVEFTILQSDLTSDVGIESATLNDAQIQACLVRRSLRGTAGSDFTFAGSRSSSRVA
jgi:hypothetical protein